MVWGDGAKEGGSANLERGGLRTHHHDRRVSMAPTPLSLPQPLIELTLGPKTRSLWRRGGGPGLPARKDKGARSALARHRRSGAGRRHARSFRGRRTTLRFSFFSAARSKTPLFVCSHQFSLLSSSSRPRLGDRPLGRGPRRRRCRCCTAAPSASPRRLGRRCSTTTTTGHIPHHPVQQHPEPALGLRNPSSSTTPNPPRQPPRQHCRHQHQQRPCSRQRLGRH